MSRQDRNGDGNYGYEDQQRFLSNFNRTRCRRRRGRCPFETNVACPTAAAVGFGQHLLLGIVPMLPVPISGVSTDVAFLFVTWAPWDFDHFQKGSVALESSQFATGCGMR